MVNSRKIFFYQNVKLLAFKVLTRLSRVQDDKNYDDSMTLYPRGQIAVILLSLRI